MGAAASGALSRAPCGCNGADPDDRAAVLVCRSDPFRHSHHGRSRQGILRIEIWRDTGAGPSMVLDADRSRSGTAPSHRLRPVDLHGGDLILPAGGSGSRLTNTGTWG